MNNPGLYFLTGPNGSGKSTLLFSLAGQLAPTQGQVWLDGQPLYGKGHWGLRALAKRLVYLPQLTDCPDDMPAMQLVLLGLFPHLPLVSFTSAADIEKAKSALAQVGFRPSEKQPMGKLSGGERQLAWLAQGLLQDGPIWLLDEPTQHLDAARRAHLFLLLQRLAIDFGKTLLVATHELENLARMPSATHLDLLRPEAGFVPCTEAEIAQTLANHREASGLF